MFLSVRSSMSIVQRSGMTTENMDELVTDLYCEKAVVEKEYSTYQLRKPFRYTAADYLSEHPKFGRKCEIEQKKDIKKN